MHASLTHIRKRLPEEVFSEVFQFVLRIAGNKKLLSGKTVAVDSTTLEANAATFATSATPADRAAVGSAA